MNVVALLPAPALSRLRVALAGDAVIAEVSALDGDDGLESRLARRDVDLVVIDPGDRRLERRAHTLGVVLAQHLAVPVLLYTPLTLAGVSAAAQLLPAGTRRLCIAGAEDQPGAMRALAIHMTMDALAARLLAAIARPLAQLPPSVIRAVQALFASPRRFRSVEDIASAAAVTRRHLARVTRRVGFASCRDLLAVARVLSTYRELQREHCAFAHAAERLHADPRVLARQIRATAGVPHPADLAALDADELLGRCVRTLCRPTGVAPRMRRTRRARTTPRA